MDWCAGLRAVSKWRGMMGCALAGVAAPARGERVAWDLHQSARSTCRDANGCWNRRGGGTVWPSA